MKIIIFPGPPKTATTWFYEQLSKQKNIKIVNGKEFLINKKNLQLISSLRNTKKNIAIFNHEILISKKINLFREFDPHFFIILRNPEERIISEINEYIKSGFLTKKDIIENTPKFKENIKKIFTQSDYEKLTNEIFENNYKCTFINFTSIKQNEIKVFEFFAAKYNFSINKFKPNIIVNKNKINRYPNLLYGIRFLLRELFIKFNIWSFFKNLKLIQNLFFQEKNINFIINFSKSQKDTIAKLNNKYLNFCKKVKYEQTINENITHF